MVYTSITRQTLVKCIEGIIKPHRYYICPSMEQRLTYEKTIDTIRHARIVVRCTINACKIKEYVSCDRVIK